MPLPKLAPGAVVYLPGTGKRGDEGDAHRCIVVAEDPKSGDLLLVPICSHHDKCDKTVVLRDVNLKTSANVSLITRTSYLAYYQSKMISKVSLQKRVESGEIQYRGDVSANLLAQVRKGVGESKETEPWFKDKYDALTAPPKKGKVWGG
jgi:hypothetical protein